MPFSRHTGQIPESTWTLGFREMTEPWKGAVGCLGVAVFFAMTIGIISWQAVEQSPEEWVLRGRDAGMLWERGRGALLLTECYGVRWTPLRPDLTLKDCFSMANVSWYGGPSIRAQRWPLNDAESPAQPLVSGNLGTNPEGFGPVLERYFLGSTGNHPLPCPVSNSFNPCASPLPSSPLKQLFKSSVDVSGNKISHKCGIWAHGMDPTLPHPCGRGRGAEAECLSMGWPKSPWGCATLLVCLGGWGGGGPGGAPPAKIKRGLRSLVRRLKRHRLQEGVVALGERSTAVLAAADLVPSERRKRQAPALVEPLELSITLSPYPRPGGSSVRDPLSPQTKIKAEQSPSGLSFIKGHNPIPLRWGTAVQGEAASLLAPTEAVLKFPLPEKRCQCSENPSIQFFVIPLLTTWKGQLCARLNVTSEAALGWYLARARRLRQALGATYVAFEGVEGNSFLEQDVPAPTELAGDGYTEVLAAALATLGNGTVISAGTRSSHLPLFVQMSPLRSDWSHAGLKGLIPSVLHYSLLGYNFFIPDAVGGSVAGAAPQDPELFVRWLQIVTFLPVMAFGTPPWLCCDAWVVNLTRQCIQRHQDFVVPLLLKYSEEWQSLGYPIFRPAWWLSPTDPVAFTIEDEFLIGDEVLVAPITEKGQTWRDIYLPGEGHLWLDTNTARVFDGGTTLRNYSASLAEVPVFVKTS
ncbi:PREDICTED: SITS-binding protein-like [Corvus brachyrhynchos]|uniref:SITS-binding protein-like n=1 Tax=Corvus brachyrhynchos TaxID=85066 RepID=UPI0008167666|nr:PREDICTED: SITS-binding protein-like [Corvus brachyrhynchos]